MENMSECKETDEGTKATAEFSALETPEAKACLETTDNTLIESMKSLSLDEKLGAFKEMEEQCADIEGRNPRVFEGGTLGKEGELFRSSMEKVEVDKGKLAEWRKIDGNRISDLRKHVFSITDAKLNPGAAVSFGRTCSEKCVDNDVRSGMCRYG